MKVILEGEKDNLALVPGLMRFKKGGPFTYVVLALTRFELRIYDDYNSDIILKDEHLHLIKSKIDINSFNNVKIYKVKSSSLGILNKVLIMKNNEVLLSIFVYEKNENILKNFLKECKRLGKAIQY